MILLMCPNITELDISLPWDCHDTYLLAELFAVITSPQRKPPPNDRSAYEPPSARYVTSQFLGASWPDARWQQPGVLEYLSEFTLRSDLNTGWEAILVNVMLLPSLKILRIYNLIEGPPTDEPAAVTANIMGQAQTHKLQTLHLPECQLSDGRLRELIQLFPHLSTLDVDWSVYHHGFISLMRIGRAIARYIPGLSHLTLDASLCSLDEDSFDKDRRMCDTICDSIKEMQHLERLKINDQAVWSPLHIKNSENRGIEPCKLQMPGIRHILPTRVTWLEIVSPFHGPDMGWGDPKLYGQYQSLQDRDLRALLLDESFTELERLDIHNCKRELDTNSIRERGWLHEAVGTERGAKVERLSRLETGER